MPSTLDIVTLRSLVTVAACGGFHRAAHALHLTQAAVSRHVQRLEDILGETLVDRDGRGIRFTLAGERFLPHARAVLAAHDAALAEFGRPADTLTVGAMDHAADALLPDLVRRLGAEFPGRRVELRLGRSAVLRASLASSHLDVALVLERLTRRHHDPHAIGTRWAAADAWSPPETPETSETSETSETPLPLVLFDHDCGLRTGALDTLTGAGLPHEIAVQAPDLTGIHAATRAGMGVTLLPALGRLPDRLRVLTGLPAPPSVLFGVHTAPQVDERDARVVRDLVDDLVHVATRDAAAS